MQVTRRTGTKPLVTELEGALVRIGRQDKDNSWPTASLKDPEVSQEHLELAWDSSKRGWTCQDVGSSNGTQLNSRRLQPQGQHSVLRRLCAGQQPAPLTDCTAEKSAALKTGDVVCLGGSTTLLIEVRCCML